MKILFVCLGNICRSPTAEGVFKSLLAKEGISGNIVDSAGTSASHVGENADSRMRDHARKRGYELTSLSRKFDKNKDFEQFDKIIVMDSTNRTNILKLDIHNAYKDKVFLMGDFCQKQKVVDVPDPYYGGPDGFEDVMDIIEDACVGLLDLIKRENET